MTKAQKLADNLWYYINEYVMAMEGGSKKSIAFESRRLDREIIKAISTRSKM